MGNLDVTLEAPDGWEPSPSTREAMQFAQEERIDAHWEDFSRKSEELSALTVGAKLWILVDIDEGPKPALYGDVKVFSSEEKRLEALKDIIYTLMESDGWKQGSSHQAQKIDDLFLKGWVKNAIEEAEVYFNSRFLLLERNVL